MRLKPKMRTVALKLDALPYGFQIIFTSDVQGTRDVLGLSASAACVAFVATYSGYCKIVLPENATVDIIAHEADHAIFCMLDYCDIKVTNDNNELHAYYLQYLIKVILEKRDGKRNKKKF
jgi:hypothetical protein